MVSAYPGLQVIGNSGKAGTLKQPICIFSKHLQWLDYGEMARLASRIGFTGIDLTVRPGGHVLPENVRRDLPVALEKIREAGMDVPMISTAITDPKDPLTHDILETAGKLGIRIYRPGWYKYNSTVPARMPALEILNEAKQQLKGLQKINKANNIAASYQNHAGLYVGSSGWDLRHMIDGLDPLWTGVQFDIRHAIVEGPETWKVFLEILAPYINSLDIKDYSWQSEDSTGSASKTPQLVNIPLGEGMVPFAEYLALLKQYKISAPFSIHYEYPLGGAEHGDRELGIPREMFEKQVGKDLDYFKNLLAAHQ